MTEIRSKQDVDRVRQRAGSRKATFSRIRAVLEMYRQGRSASACMDEIDKAMKAVK